MAVAERSEHTPAQHSRPSTGAADAGKLFEEHSDRLFAYCLRFLGGRADAEDAVQTTFLYAHRALERGVAPESEYVWLHSIAKNVCRWQRRTIARRGTLSSAVDLDLIAGSTRSPGDDEQELVDALPEALASMPEAQRRAILLREWHGLSSSEIASQLGMSPAATYALLTRARRSLAHALTAARQPVLSLNFGSLFLKLKALVTGGTAKFVATGVAVGTVAVGGVTIERAIDGTKPTTRPDSALDAFAGSQAQRVAVVSATTLASRSALPSLFTRTPGPAPRADAVPQAGLTPAVVAVDPVAIPDSAEAAPPASTAPDADPPPSALPPTVPEPAASLLEGATELLPPVNLDLPPLPRDLVPPLLEGDPPLEDVLSDPLAPPPLPELKLPLP